MKCAKSVISLLATSLLASAAVADEGMYGRAGGRTGSELIAHVVRDGYPASVQADEQPVTIYGQAGLPVGAERIEYVVRHARPSKSPVSVVDQGFGRAGGAVGVDRPENERRIVAAGSAR